MIINTIFKSLLSVLICIMTVTIISCNNDDTTTETTEELPDDCIRFPGNDERLPASIAAEILDLHNQKRAQYCIPPLKWDNNLARVAQWWAETSGADGPHSSSKDRLQKYKEFSGCTECPESIGENLHWRQPWDFFDTSYVAGWLSEEDDAPECNRGGAHYTQMVFELATKVGCAAFIDDAGRLHFVCEYDKWQGAHNPVFPDENCDCGGAQFIKAVACE